MLQRYIAHAALALTALVANRLAAQCTLGVLGSGYPSTLLSVQIQANPGDFSLVAVSDAWGNVSIPLGAATINLRVMQPWTILETGFANSTGFAVLNLRVPAGVTPMNLFGQGLVLQAPFTGVPQFCSTYVVPFHIG